MSDVKYVRPAHPDDAKAICEIYCPYVLETSISFEVEAPTVAAMRDRISTTLVKYPWLVFERGAQLLGFAYASQHRVREAYRWSVDVAVYVRCGHAGLGIGTVLYSVLLSELQKLGFANAFAGISLPNTASVKLHEAMGFQAIGVYKGVGFKQGEWRDVGWWQRSFASSLNPDEPRKFGTELLARDATELLARDATELLARDATELLAKDATE